MENNIKNLKGLLVSKDFDINKKENYLSLLTNNEEEYFIDPRKNVEIAKLSNKFIYLKAVTENYFIKKIIEHKIIEKL